jgi:hypothetical protein
MLHRMNGALALSRRSLPLLAVLPRAARGGLPVPRFQEWVGQTALLSAPGGSARLLLMESGGGVLSVSMLLFCRPVQLLGWDIAADGLDLTYRRLAVLRPGAIVAGRARLLAGGEAVEWVERETRIATFEGFLPAERAASCS